MLKYALFAVLLCSFHYKTSVAQLTFELPDRESMCFHDELEANISIYLVYQVLTGGQQDVDITIDDPTNEQIYHVVRVRSDHHTFRANLTGTYTLCFSNEFSSISHKLIWMYWRVKPEEPLPGIGGHATALTQMETSAVDIHENLNSIIESQTHQRLMEAHDRKRGEELNETVSKWAVFDTVCVILIVASQTWMLKSFFAEKKPASGH